MTYTVTATQLPEVLVLEPRVFGDARGFFYESFNAREFEKATGLKHSFVQDNHSRSVRGVLRGLHFQESNPQGKLVRVIQGSVFDVVVDIRKRSETYGTWVGVELSEENRKQLWVPEGFAHGFLVLSAVAEFLYKTTDYYRKNDERAIRWDDPEIGIRWPTGTDPLLSSRDKIAPMLRDVR